MRSASSPWARRMATSRLVDRALRRHACRPHRRYRPVPHRSEGAVSAGVRRIEAVAGAAADRRGRGIQPPPGGSRGDAQSPGRGTARPHPALQEDKKRLERQVSDLQKKLAIGAPPTQSRTSPASNSPAAMSGKSRRRNSSPSPTAIAERAGLRRGRAGLHAGRQSRASWSPCRTTQPAHSAVDLVRAAAVAVGGPVAAATKPSPKPAAPTAPMGSSSVGHPYRDRILRNKCPLFEKSGAKTSAKLGPVALAQNGTGPCKKYSEEG